MTSFVRKVLLCLLFAHWLAVTKCHGSTTRPVIDPRATDNDGNVTFRCSGNNELILLFWKVNGVSTVRTPGDQRDPLPEGVNNITINGSEQVLDIRIPKQPFYREKRLRLVCCAYIVQNGIPGREVCSAPPLCTDGFEDLADCKQTPPIPPIPPSVSSSSTVTPHSVSMGILLGLLLGTIIMKNS